MAWHTNGWPGLLALLASDSPADKELGLAILKHDAAVFRAARAVAPCSTYLDKVVQKSAFSTAA
eukprot:7008440-Lingulodinium_polyedra.AAC.1